MMSGMTDNNKSEIHRLAGPVSAQSTDADYRYALASVGKPNTPFNVNRDGEVDQLFTLDGASQRVLSVSQRLIFRQVYDYSFLANQSVERRIYDYMR